MKNLLHEILFGKNTKISGLTALMIVAFVALGCTCGKNFNFSNLSNSSGNTTPTPPPFNAGDDATPKPRTNSTAKIDASKGVVPSDDDLQELVKSTLLEFDDGVQADDFTDFYATVAKPWQKQTSPEKMQGMFKDFVDKKITINSISSRDAEFSPDPVVEKVYGYKTLKVLGQYKTMPNLTKFELNYIAEGRDWKLVKIIVDTTEKN